MPLCQRASFYRKIVGRCFLISSVCFGCNCHFPSSNRFCIVKSVFLCQDLVALFWMVSSIDPNSKVVGDL